MRFILITVLLLLPIFVSVAQSDKTPNAYLCIPDMSTGFIYIDNRWQSSIFNISGDKYILRRSKDSDVLNESPWLWGEFGASRLLTTCKEPNKWGTIICDDIEVIHVNTETLRYQTYYPHGYINGKDNSNDTPLIEIGKCSPL